MVGGSWLDPDGLYRQYGTQKAVPTTMGDYLAYGDTREIEFTLTPANLTTTPVIVGNTTFFGGNSQTFIESVTTDVDATALAGGTSISVGTMNLDRSTVISNTAFLSAAPLADHTAAGQQKVYTPPVTGTGTSVGTAPTFTSGGVYITALAAGTYTGVGTIKVRIRYRGIGTITQ
jgi:hypothetical protein